MESKVIGKRKAEPLSDSPSKRQKTDEQFQMLEHSILYLPLGEFPIVSGKLKLAGFDMVSFQIGTLLGLYSYRNRKRVHFR